MARHPLHRDPWVYVGNPPKCFLSGTQATCPEGMKLGVRSGSPFGACKCNCFFPQTDQDKNRYSEEMPWDPLLNEKKTFCFDNKDERHYAFFAPTGQCFPLLSKVFNSMKFVLTGGRLTTVPNS
jgi:hypothetical protein